MSVKSVDSIYVYLAPLVHQFLLSLAQAALPWCMIPRESAILGRKHHSLPRDANPRTICATVIGITAIIWIIHADLALGAQDPCKTSTCLRWVVVDANTNAICAAVSRVARANRTEEIRG